MAKTSKSGWRDKLEKLRGAYSDNTIRSYRTDFSHFEAWSEENGHPPLTASAELVDEYVAELSITHAPATVRRRIAAISRVFQLCGAEDSTKSELVRMGLRRLLRAKGQRQKQVAGLRADLRDGLIAAAAPTLMGARDRALVSAGYKTLCRRSELVALLVRDIAIGPGGSGTVLVRRSKADQVGQGRLAYLSPQSMEWLRQWLVMSGIRAGPIFRGVRADRVFNRQLNPFTVAQIIKRLARRAGLAADLTARLSGHSFRIGAALDMTENGIDLVPIMHAGGWRSPEMVVRYTAQINVAQSGMALLYARRFENLYGERDPRRPTT